MLIYKSWKILTQLDNYKYKDLKKRMKEQSRKYLVLDFQTNE